MTAQEILSRESLIKELNQEIKKCTLCAISKTRKNAVPGEGDINTSIMFIGEAPGEDEDLQGRPFVGRAGQLLTKLLLKVKIKREDVFIGNILKCRPPGNRNPLDEEIKNCSNFLYTQISLIKPEIICLLGNFALQTLLKRDYTIGKVHGKIMQKDGFYFLPLYHPAAALHKHSAEMMEVMEKDLLILKNYIG